MFLYLAYFSINNISLITLYRGYIFNFFQNVMTFYNIVFTILWYYSITHRHFFVFQYSSSIKKLQWISFYVQMCLYTHGKIHEYVFPMYWLIFQLSQRIIAGEIIKWKTGFHVERSPRKKRTIIFTCQYPGDEPVSYAPAVFTCSPMSVSVITRK